MVENKKGEEEALSGRFLSVGGNLLLSLGS